MSATIRKEGGYTLLQVALALALLGIVMGAVVSSMIVGQKSMGQGQAIANINATAQRILETVLADMRQSGADPAADFDPPAGQSASSTSFRKNQGWLAGQTINWSGLYRYRLVGNAVVQTEPAGTDHTLGNGVTAFTVARDAAGTEVTVTLSVAGTLNDGTSYTKTSVEKVHLRN